METLTSLAEIDFDFMDESFSSCMGSAINGFDDGFDSDSELESRPGIAAWNDDLESLLATTVDSLFEMFEEEVEKKSRVHRHQTTAVDSLFEMSNGGIVETVSPHKESRSRPLQSSSSTCSPCSTTSSKSAASYSKSRSLLKKKKKKGVSLLARPMVSWKHDMRSRNENTIRDYSRPSNRNSKSPTKSASYSLLAPSPAKSVSQISRHVDKETVEIVTAVTIPPDHDYCKQLF